MPWTASARHQYARTATRYTTDLTDTEFALIAPPPAYSSLRHRFRNGPLGVKPLEQVSRRRVHASVRGRHDGRHTMPSGEEPTSQSLAAWFRPEGSDHLRCPGFVGSRVPATGPRGSRTVRSRSEAARFAPDDYASAASLPKRNSLPSTHRRCRRAESLRARATLARFMPRRLATSSAQRFRVENRPVLVSIACAAS
jgi:hypothetical protein